LLVPEIIRIDPALALTLQFLLIEKPLVSVSWFAEEPTRLEDRPLLRNK
jgi:hypothetical protein